LDQFAGKTLPAPEFDVVYSGELSCRPGELPVRDDHRVLAAVLGFGRDHLLDRLRVDAPVPPLELHDAPATVAGHNQIGSPIPRIRRQVHAITLALEQEGDLLFEVSAGHSIDFGHTGTHQSSPFDQDEGYPDRRDREDHDGKGLEDGPSRFQDCQRVKQL
jgi:hypothetical protein